MNRRQKAVLIESIAVIALTAVAVWGMINFKDWVNRSEAMRAMEQLGQKALQYRQQHGAVPPETYVESIKESLEGHVRLGNLRYRAQWIDFESTPDDVLAYTERDYHSLLVGKGYVVLRLDGRVQWMSRKDFRQLLSQQRRKSPEEIQMLQE
jgi:type II secretory pathway pseudopilin PulG